MNWKRLTITQECSSFLNNYLIKEKFITIYENVCNKIL